MAVVQVRAESRCALCGQWIERDRMAAHVERSHRRPAQHECPWCGPYGTVKAHVEDGSPVCPTCDMTPGEHAYIDRILADSAGVYAEEHRAYQAERRAS